MPFRHLGLIFIIGLSSFWTEVAIANFEIGVGTTSSTSARLVPALSGSLAFGDYVLTGSSTGVRTTVYHFSAYTLGFVKRWQMGPFLWGDLSTGFGLGLAYANYGLRPAPSASEDTQSDFTAGPLFQFRWKCFGPAYIGLDNLFGLRFPKGLLALSAQDVILFSVGASL